MSWRKAAWSVYLELLLNFHIQIFHVFSFSTKLNQMSLYKETDVDNFPFPIKLDVVTGSCLMRHDIALSNFLEKVGKFSYGKKKASKVLFWRTTKAIPCPWATWHSHSESYCSSKCMYYHHLTLLSHYLHFLCIHIHFHASCRDYYLKFASKGLSSIS